MKKVVITKAGGPEVLQVQETADPTPGELEVRIDVNAAGVNYADILARKGLYPDSPPLPCTVGYEVSGVIDAVGKNVNEKLIGKDVLCLCRFGGYSNKVIVPQFNLVEKPKKLSFTDAASIPVTYLTAYMLMVVMGSLKKSETVLIHNAGGGVGLAALDIAEHIGARSIGTASSFKHDFLKDRGLDLPIDYRNNDWLPIVLQNTDNKGVELVIDPLGGSSWKKSYKALRQSGRLGMFGASSVFKSGIMDYLSFAVQMPWFNPVSLMNSNKAVFGVNLGHLWKEGKKVKSWLDDIMDGVQSGWVRPYVDKTFSFEQAGEAHSYMEQRKNKGKVILTP